MATPSSLFFGINNKEGNTQTPPLQPPQLHHQQHPLVVDAPPSSSTAQPPAKKKRNLPGAPSKYPDAEVIALSPKTLMATNRFICEVCNKGFQREQNLQLHRRGHNLPWKLKQKNKLDPVRKKVYLCPEPTCVHHDPTRALGDLTGIKKHFSRKHGEKKFKCEKCSKRYAVQSDWKAHSKTCGTREYRCDCGTLFSRRDSFITHRAFCDALAQESARHPTSLSTLGSHLFGNTGIGSGGNNMGLGMGISHQGTSHLPSFSDHQMTSESLRVGGGARQQMEHLLGAPFRSQQQMNMQPLGQPNFYLSDQHGTSQGGYENCGQDQNTGQNGLGGGIFSNKLFQGQVNQMTDFQGNGSNNHFNLGFFSGNNNSTTDNNTMNSGSTGSGDHSSGLFSPGGGLFGGPPQMSSSGGLSSLYNTGLQHQSAMSATALLQKAAQMGSTTSTTNTSATALLKGFDSKPPPPCPPTSGGGFGGLFGENDQNNLHDLLLRDLSRDNHLMNSSIFDIGGNNQQGGTNNNMNPNNNKNGFNNPNTKPVQGGLTPGSSDPLTRDFLGVGQIVRSMSGGGFTPRPEQHQGSTGTNFNNSDQTNNNNNINNNSNNNINNDKNNTNNNNNNANYTGPTSSQSYGGGNTFQ